MNQPRYTLEEAQDELARRTCSNHGHNYRVIEARSHTDPSREEPQTVVCEWCFKTWQINKEQQ